MFEIGTLAFLGDIGGGELLVVFAAILLLFGGKQLPPMARSLGKMIEDLRRASQEFRDQLLNADRENEPPEPESQPPAPAPTSPAPPADPAIHPSSLHGGEQDGKEPRERAG